jgi:hypothetical protein
LALIGLSGKQIKNLRSGPATPGTRALLGPPRGCRGQSRLSPGGLTEATYRDARFSSQIKLTLPTAYLLIYAPDLNPKGIQESRRKTEEEDEEDDGSWSEEEAVSD